MELGIIGLPTSGKTTVFNALTGAHRPTSVASTGKLEVFSLVVDVPDARVDALSAIYQPRKTSYAKVTYTDIAGLDKDLGKTGLSGQLRNKITPMDAFVHVVRAFESATVPHPLDSVNPQRDVDALDTEFLLADMVTVENRLARVAERLQKGARADERRVLEKDAALFQELQQALGDGTPLRNLGLSREQCAHLSGYGLLTLKPVLVLVNIGDDDVDPATLIDYPHENSAVIALKGRLEMEISQLDPEEADLFKEEFGIETLARERVIRASYDLVNLHTFFTVGKDEVRAWNLTVGGTALDAAATVHTDLARGFIRAEVIPFDVLIARGGDMAAARKVGQVQLEGKEYIVQDGDIVHIRFSI